MPKTAPSTSRAAPRYLGPAGPLGFHASIAGGIELAPARARALGARALQVFSHSPRVWKSAAVSADTAAAFRLAVEQNELAAVVCHASYLINLGSAEDGLWRHGIDAFVDEVERCDRLGIDRLVIHPGSRGEQTLGQGRRRVLRALNEIVRRTPHAAVTILLESTAGAGAHLGDTLDDLAWWLDHHRRPERLGICLDSCHLFAAGYPLHEPDGLDALLTEIDDRLGLARLGCWHLNDSAGEFGSHVDRHARLGRGNIGRDFFARLLHDRRLHGIPKLLEVPGGDEAFAGDLRLLRRLAPRQ